MKHQLPKARRGGKALLALALVLTGFSTAVAQTNLAIGTGTGTSTNLPITGYFGYSYSQTIYTAAELNAAGGSIGTISKIRYYYNSGGGTNINNANGWTVYMAHTSKTAFANTTDWVLSGAMTQVFSGTVTFPAAGNWMEITLATPFQWNGTDNIVVGVDENAAGYSSSAMYFNITSSTTGKSIYYYSDSNNPNPASPPTASATPASLPNTQFVWTAAPNCSGTPAHTSVVASATTICPGASVNLSLTPSVFQAGLQYQWQANTGSGWNNIAGATAPTRVTGPVSTTTTYRAHLTCSFSSLADTSDVQLITVNPLPPVAVSEDTVATCSGEPAQITASGAAAYAWTPTTAVTPSATSASVNLMPTAPTTYTVTGTDANGCTNTASVRIIPVANIVASVMQSPAEICEPGSPVTLTVGGIPTAITSDGSWNYRWLAADGVTEVQPWNSSNEYSFIPTQDSVYAFYYQIRSTTCPDNEVDSIRYSLVSGFGAEVALVPFNCNSNGIITLSDIFGQREVDEIYANSFNGSSSMTGVTLSGNASLTGGRLVITPSATGNSGNALISVPGQSLGTNNSMTVSFKMTADTPINIYGTGGADGITYSFGNDANPTAVGSNPNGRGTKLRLSFDSASNGSENGNAPGIYLVYGWNSATAFGPTSTGVLAYSSNIASWKTLTDVPVELVIDTDGKAKVTVNGTVIFQNIQMPAAYMSADVSAWTHLFSAGTGGDALRHAIKDFSVQTEALQLGISQGAATVLPSEWQTDNVFDNLLPGVYNVWIAKNQAADCSRNIGQFEILNTNPVVDLGNDTTICEGETLVLDAGNPGSVYNWSGTNAYTQTITVSTAGNYFVQLTNPDGCTGIGAITVTVNEAPTASGIFSNGNFPTVFFSASNPQNADTYSWDFGDGSTLANGPSSISHTYTEDGTFTVTLTLANECGTETVTTAISINDYTALSENSIDGLQVYPNPATNEVSILVPGGESSVAVYDMAGSLVLDNREFSGKTSVDVSAWNRGMYFLHITNGGTTTISKLTVK